MFLVLAESWSLPLSATLITPMGLFSVMGAVYLHGQNNIFIQT